MDTALKALAMLGGLLLHGPGGAASTPPQLFGTVEFRVDSLAALPQWQHVLRQIDREHRLYRASAPQRRSPPARPAAPLAWQALLESQGGQRPFDQIQAVNQFLNQWQYKTDEQATASATIGPRRSSSSAARGLRGLSRSPST